MKKIILFGLLLILISCKLVNKVLISHAADNSKMKVYTNGDKNIVFIPMLHVSKPEFYERSKKSLDSLRELNYTVFYESVVPNKELDSVSKMVMYKKLRKVVGFFPDYVNNKQFRRYNIKGFIQQSDENTGVNPAIDIRADLPLDELIAQYEKEKGTIVLSDYDLKTSLGEKYKAKVNQVNKDFLIETLRNNCLFKMVHESKAKKIAIVYGKAHMYALFDNLEKHDSLWRYVPSWEIRESKLKAVQ